MGSLGNNCGHYENHKMAILQPIVSFTYFYFAKYHTFYGLKPCKVLTVTFDENVDDYSIRHGCDGTFGFSSIIRVFWDWEKKNRAGN